jgi:hypothetical protein
MMTSSTPAYDGPSFGGVAKSPTKSRDKNQKLRIKNKESRMFVLHPRLDFPLRFVWQLLLLTSAALWAHDAYASILVTNFGTDSSSCGSSASPCRSISQAIENATSGETIYVGAGRYGDVSGTGTFTGPGDEHAQPASGQFDYSGCVVCISKAVQIYSLNGPALTVIQANSAANFPNAVLITVDGVTFGSPGHGFGIANGGGNGIVVDLEQSPAIAHGVTVSGNIDAGDSQGFVFEGPPGEPTDGRCPPGCPFPANTGVFRFSDNRANGSGTGFRILAEASGCCTGPLNNMQIVLQDNVAVGTQTGFFVDKGVLINCDGCGDGATASNVSVSNNFAANSGVGFSLFTAGLVMQNVALSSATAGFVITAPAGAFTGNSAIGNYGPGVVVLFFTDNGGHDPPIDFGKFSGNNLYGNDRNRQPAAVSSSLPTLFPYNPGPSARCGILNLGAIAAAEVTDTPPQIPVPPFRGATVEAVEGFWGSSKGPQSTGPGDTVGGACDQNGATTTASKPFLTSPVAIPAAPAL